MEEKIKKHCPNCSQLYYLTCLPPHLKGNLPVFLSCGHSICEACVKNIVKFAEPIECKVCHQTSEVKTKDVTKFIQNKKEFYQQFPVNMFMLGELTMDLINESDTKKDCNQNYFIDLKSIIQNTDYTTGKCIECHQVTNKMCQQCETILCDNCFNRSHKNFVVFKNHVLKNIEPLIKCNKCKVHTDKTLDYFCKDCKKSICMDCLMVGGEKSCKNHNVASMQEVNEGFLEELNVVFPKVDETFRRLTKTAVDVGHLLYNTVNETGSVSELTKMVASVEQHFSKLNSTVQKHKTEVVEIITKLKFSEKESLFKARDEVTESIKKAKEILNTMTLSLDPKKMKLLNLSVLLEDAKQIADCPWYLNKSDIKNENLKVAVNEDLCNLISDYIHLEGNASSGYSLRAAGQLEGVELPPPPVAPVYPPEMPKDVRQSSVPAHHQAGAEKARGPRQPLPFYQQAPKFRSKTGSTSSLNSADSDPPDHAAPARYGDQKPVVQPVMPFAESRVPKQLREGAQEIIYISHIVDPHNFYVQRACHQSLVKEMLREFRNSVSSPKPSAGLLMEGKLYLTYNSTDNMWQRCRIISIDRRVPEKPVCTVFCIDFGSTEVVSIDKLRLLQPGRVQSPPPLAINCSLANCVPKNGSWTSEDSYLIQNIINNKQAVIYIRNIRSTANFAMTLVCDVTTIEDGVSLAHALCFHERARMPNQKLQYPKICGLSEKPKLFMLNNSLKQRSVEEVYITYICSPDKFFVRERHLQSVYEKLTEDLEAEYSAAVNNDSVYLPEVGMVVVVNLEKLPGGVPAVPGAGAGAAAWARGVVLELPGRGRARVLLPDSGAAPLLHWAALRHPRHHLTTHRALATECHLAGVTPLNKKWSAGSVALLQRFAERPLRLIVEDARNRSSLGVTLYDPAAPDELCVNSEMIKYKFAITFGLFRFNASNIDEDQVQGNKSPVEDRPEPQKNDSKIRILKRNEDLEISAENLEAKDKGPLRLEAKILQYQSPSLLYVALAHQQATFSLLFERIQVHYSEPTPDNTKTDWKEGDRCCAFCVESKTWRRAVIMETQGDAAKVFYSDFALVETIPLADLRELTQDFASLGHAAIKCHLSGVMPAVGTEWPSVTKEYLMELLEAYQRVFITKIGSFKDNSMPVELWVYHTVQGGALEPDAAEWRCLNQKIVDQGLGIPDKSQEATGGEFGPLPEHGATGRAVVCPRGWRPPPPPAPGPARRARAASPASPEPGPAPGPEPGPEPGGCNTVFISDWLPAEELPDTEFTAFPTYIDNDGVVFLHTLKAQATLDLIRKALEMRFRKPDPKAKSARWSVGEPCVALYFLDNRFYRGRVLEVNAETATCLVQYVDYGNEEHCSFINMRKSIALHQIPVQASKCILARIRPTGNQWDRTTLDYIHKSVVEKECTVKVSGERFSNLIPIELKYDKLLINDHLVDFEMAEYADGSKAVVRKFAPDKSYKKHTADELKSDSGPDYIAEDDSAGRLTPGHELSFDAKSFENSDWNLIMEQERCSSENSLFTYPAPDVEEFASNISIINDIDTLELAIVHSDKDNLLYEEMYESIQREGASKPPLNGIFENKACVALFNEDGLWYRASILKYSKTKGLVKVRYVDYGNSDVVSVSNVREIDEQWIILPPATIEAKLYDVTINPDLDINFVAQKMIDTFLDKGPFQTKIMKYENSLPLVQLTNEEGELVYSELINTAILV